MSSKKKDCKRTYKNIPSWMFLCNKINNSESTDIQLRKHAKDIGIETKGKSRNVLCRELAKSYDKKIKIEKKENVEILKIEKKEDIKNIEVLKTQLAELINNAENGYSNYFTVLDIDDWLQDKTSYDYHTIIYYSRNYKLIKNNKKIQNELYKFEKFPTLKEMLKLLIDSIEMLCISEKQRYVLFLKKIFTMGEKSDDEDIGIGEFYEYEYENEYDVLKSVEKKY